MEQLQGDQNFQEAGGSPEIEEEKPKSLSISVLALLLANMIPLFGVLYLGWSAVIILLLSCIENIIVGFLNIPKMALCPIKIPAIILPNEVSPAMREALSKVNLPGFHFVSIILKVVAIPFLAQTYGGFVYTQIAVLFFMMMDIPGTLESINLLTLLGLLISALALTVSHVISFFTNFVGRREYQHTDLIRQAFKPYARVFVMTVTILIGGGLSINMGDPLWALVVLVILKIGVDVASHVAEHRKYAEPPLTTETVVPEAFTTESSTTETAAADTAMTEAGSTDIGITDLKSRWTINIMGFNWSLDRFVPRKRPEDKDKGT